MRRKDKEITDRSQIDSIIGRASVCRLGLADGNVPYIVPMCFGYDGTHIYLHSANEGRKIEMLKRNSTVCFEFDILAEAVKGEKPCSSSMRYMSVMGEGKATFVEDAGEKQEALRIILKQYGHAEGPVSGKEASGIVVIKVAVAGMSGKKSKI